MSRIVLLGGGSGSRDITMALCGAGHAVTRVVPAWDSGGSSRALREALGMLSIGDIRQALMTMAHGEGRAGGVVRFFNARLSEGADRAALRAEFDFYAGGAHPLLASMAPDIRAAILDCLRLLGARLPAGFDLGRASIGNFVLAGAYLAHGRNVNAAIGVFRTLCEIDGKVWPSTTSDDAALSAELRDGRVIGGQERITALAAQEARVGIRRVRLGGAGDPGDPDGAPAANPAALEAIAEADALVFGPGSFFTSTLPHLLVQGIPEAIASTSPSVPKVLVGNLLECPETTGRTLAELVAAFSEAAGAAGLPTHVLAHRGHVPFERVLHGFRYLSEGTTTAPQPQWIADDFEDPWHRGRHDAPKLVAALSALLPRA